MHEFAPARRDPSISIRAFALADQSITYDFYDHDDGAVELATAYRSCIVEELGRLKRLWAYASHIWFSTDDVYFLCHYERFEVFVTALVLRLRRKRVFIMNDSKFDDYQRYILRELAKSIFYIPYCGALVSGARSAAYVRFLGVRGKIETGSDTIDVRSVTRAGPGSLSSGLPTEYFISVNRLVSKKNVELTIRAFNSAYRDMDRPVSLLIVGDGPERALLGELVHCLGIEDRVIFLGNIPNDLTVSLISRAVGLVLVSTSEQWGLVVNEALACAVPVIVSDAVGLANLSIRSFVNGFVIESNNQLGLTRAMLAVYRGDPRLETQRPEMYAASVDRFADAVLSLLAG